jgi:DNA-binding NarL/FixJ family response regulator
VNVRTTVFVHADDPVSHAGLEQLLRLRPDLLVLGPQQIDEAQVAVIGTDAVDDDTVRTICAVQRDGCPRVVIVAAQLDELSVITASEAGALGMLRRRDASAECLARVVAQVAGGEASVPADLIGQLLVAVRHLRRSGTTALRDSPVALSSREQDIIRLLADGSDTAEIAARLSYSERTVKGVIHDVANRWQLRNRSHVVAYALRNAMI